MSIRWFKSIAATATVAVLAACGSSSTHEPNLVEKAQSDPRFSVLVEAVVAADLASTLSGPATYTVFAPTNDAFVALLGELNLSKAQLLADKPLLTAVLQYHVLSGIVPKASVPAGKAITPLSGGIFKIDATANGLVATDGRNRTSRLIETDVSATNGVIHAIDRVLLPANKTIVETAQSLPDFSILVEAVVAANLTGTLSGTTQLTVFAPTNTAFANLLAELSLTKAQLLADTVLLTKVLTYHVVPGRVLKADVPVGVQIATVEGGTFSISPNLAITDARARVSNIVTTDVLASNGVIHVIDKVVLPAP